jgi:4-hydroxy-3-methylbut-2-enyl diphosphate reductase
MEVLQRRFPHLQKPPKEDICYATTNRQTAIRELAQQCDLVLIVGSNTSSNSNRLREVAEEYGAEAHLINGAGGVQEGWKHEYRTVGISSGASTPEILVEDVIGELMKANPDASMEILETVREDVNFRPSRDLIQLAMAS